MADKGRIQGRAVIRREPLVMRFLLALLPGPCTSHRCRGIGWTRCWTCGAHVREVIYGWGPKRRM